MAEFRHKDLKSKTFPWGPIVAVHKIGKHVIVEHHPMIFDGPCGTGRYEPVKTTFSVEKRSSYEGANTLDHAILIAIGDKRKTGGAVKYAAQLLGVK